MNEFNPHSNSVQPVRRRPLTGSQHHHRPLPLPWLALALVVAGGFASTSEAFVHNAAMPSPRLLPRWGVHSGPTSLLSPKYGSSSSSLSLLKEPRVDDGFSNDTASNRIKVLEATSSSKKNKPQSELSASPSETDIATTLEVASAEEKQIYKSAIFRTLGWVGAASLFGAFLLLWFGPEVGEEFFAGYLVEQSLSVDNLFVFLLLFEYFKVPLESQDRVLNWGIGGAIVMRAIMIGLGAAALQNFHEILLVFAGILVYSSVKVLLVAEDDDEEDPSENAIVKFSQNLMSSTQEFDGDRFFTLVDGVKRATPLFICMIAVEISDVVFAVDSIPAVFGVTENPLVVFSSNMFAIMGLRSLYTILSKAAQDLKYLEPAVAVVLGFIGFKMIAEYFGYCIPTEVALVAVAGLLGTGVGLSVWEKKLDEAAENDLS